MVKSLLGVVHLRPLPSSARGGDFESVRTAALVDAVALAEGGVDGLIVENFGDAPFRKGTAADPVSPDVPAALAVVAREVGAATGLPVGINCLRNDGLAALGAAAIAGARWVRVNVLAGSFVTDQGLIDGEAARLMAYRRQLGTATAVLADLLVKHATPLAPVDPLVAARDLAQRAGADGLIVTGDRTGEPPDLELLTAVRAAVPGTDIWVGSGLGEANAAELWPHCDGAIVGTAFKEQGLVERPVDPARVRSLSAALPRGGSGSA